MKKTNVKIVLLAVTLIVVILIGIAVANMHSVIIKVAKNNAEQEALGVAEEGHVLQDKSFSSIEAGINKAGELPNLTGSKRVLSASEDGQTIDIPKGYYENIKIDASAVYNKGVEDTKKGDAVASQVLDGKYFTSNSAGVNIKGTMPNNGKVTQTINPGGSYIIPAGYHNGEGTVKANPNQNNETYTFPENHIGSEEDLGANNAYRYVNAENVYSKGVLDTKKGDAAEGNVLAGKTFTSNTAGVEKEGTMPNNGAVSKTLNAGESYTVPTGYHNGEGKVTAQTLASQTGVDSGKTAAGAGQILTGYQAWVNGSKITGTMANNGKITQTINPGGSYTIPAGYTTGGTVTANPNQNSGTYNATTRSNSTGIDLGANNTYRYVRTDNVPNTNSGTYTPTSRSASLDMGATNTYRYVNTNSVPNTNSGTYTYAANSTGGTVDLGATNTYRYVNAGNVYTKGKLDQVTSIANKKSGDFNISNGTGTLTFTGLTSGNYYFIYIAATPTTDPSLGSQSPSLTYSGASDVTTYGSMHTTGSCSQSGQTVPGLIYWAVQRFKATSTTVTLTIKPNVQNSSFPGIEKRNWFGHYFLLG